MTLDWAAIRAGALVSLVFAVPLSVAGRWAADNDNTGTALALTLGAVGGFVIGAGCAAWLQQLRTPLSHGMVTAAGTYTAAQAVFAMIRLVRGADVHWFALFFNLSAVLVAGLIGGFLGQTLQRRGFVPSSRGNRETSGTIR